MKTIQPKDFGKDHWSLLAYVEYRVQNHHGELNIQHLRTKNKAIATTPLGQNFWKPEYGTRLRGYFTATKTGNTDHRRQLRNHDDHDCLDDLEAAGYITEVGTLVNPFAKLTPLGIEMCGKLLAHKNAGEHYSTFTI